MYAGRGRLEAAYQIQEPNHRAVLYPVSSAQAPQDLTAPPKVKVSPSKEEQEL